jgi:hypothetical protein
MKDEEQDNDLTDEEFEFFMSVPLDELKAGVRNTKSLTAIKDELGEARFNKVSLKRLADLYAQGRRDTDAMIREVYEEVHGT